MNIIDLRSDTLTKPSEAMRKAMYEAEVGDDVFKEDPTVNELQRYCAELFGKDAALFVTSGVMGNQLCLRTQTQPGDELICEKNAHIFNYESASPATLSGIQLYPVAGERGMMPLDEIRAGIRPVTAYYMPRTRGVALENTHNRASGAVLPLEYMREVWELTREHSLFLHLDGARIWNASVATGIPVAEYAKYADSVSACFSKGLGAPVGSIIAGSRDMIENAFRFRKAWGGGMRQAGVLAAACLFAVKNNIPRLADDHLLARHLAEGLAAIPDIRVSSPAPPTNIILFEVVGAKPADFIARAKERGLLLLQGTVTSVRAVTSMMNTRGDIDDALQIISGTISSLKGN